LAHEPHLNTTFLICCRAKRSDCVCLLLLNRPVRLECAKFHAIVYARVNVQSTLEFSRSRYKTRTAVRVGLGLLEEIVGAQATPHFFAAHVAVWALPRPRSAVLLLLKYAFLRALLIAASLTTDGIRQATRGRDIFVIAARRRCSR
jgi:hypothetical protein